MLKCYLFSTNTIKLFYPIFSFNLCLIIYEIKHCFNIDVVQNNFDLIQSFSFEIHNDSV